MINASTVRSGGTMQVSDSVCRELYKYPQHQFIVVVGKEMNDRNHTADDLKKQAYPNIQVFCHQQPVSVKIILTGKDSFMTDLVKKYNVEAVITLFGPSYWISHVKNHLCGFARPLMMLRGTVYYDKLMPLFPKTRNLIYTAVQKKLFLRCADQFYSENVSVSEQVKKMFHTEKVSTITGNSNQIFSIPQKWDNSINLPQSDSFTLLNIASNYPYKNLSIVLPTIDYLHEHYPDFKFRFVMTVANDAFGEISQIQRDHIVFLGKVTIQQCPHLYEQSDVMFHPTLLECFSASYSDAMVMGKPIITTDLPFAHGQCSDAAIYYSPLDYKELGDKIVILSKNKELQIQLVSNGKKQLKTFDTPEDRVRKLIEIVEKEN